MPVAIAPVDGKRDAFAQGADQVAALPVDGTRAVEVVVVFGDFEHALTGDVAATENIFEERDDVFAVFGAAE